MVGFTEADEEAWHTKARGSASERYFHSARHQRREMVKRHIEP